MAATKPGRLLTPAEAAALLRVDPKTVTRWAKAGRVDCCWTLGGHRRFFADGVEQILRGEHRTQVGWTR